MNREMRTLADTVVIVLDGDTDAGRDLARRLLAEGRRVAAVSRHPGAGVRLLHGHSADRVMLIAADTTDERQWGLVLQRVTQRFGRVDDVVRAGDAVLRASA